MMPLVGPLVALGVRHGHRVMVTPHGPRYLVECSCGSPLGRVAHPTKRLANETGLEHVRSTIPPQIVERGAHVAAYVARKPPEAVVVDLCGFAAGGILVVRAHDRRVTDALALDAIANPRHAAYDAEPHELVAVHAAQVWTRYVPIEYGNPDAGGTYERELRGTVGATPAVLYARPNPATKGSTP